MYDSIQHHRKSRTELGTNRIVNIWENPGVPATRMFLLIMGSVTIRAGAQGAGCFATGIQGLEFLNSVLRITHAPRPWSGKVLFCCRAPCRFRFVCFTTNLRKYIE